jgi:hypothetical protein
MWQAQTRSVSKVQRFKCKNRGTCICCYHCVLMYRKKILIFYASFKFIMSHVTRITRNEDGTNHPGPNNTPKISVNCIFHSPLSPHQTIVPMDLRNKRCTMKYKKELKAILNAVKSIRPKCYLTIPYSLCTLWEYREGRLLARSPTKSLGYIGNHKWK